MFYDVIKRLAEDKGHTIAQLEEKAHIGNATIGGWRDTNNPQAQTLKRIADYLEVPYEAVFNEECFREAHTVERNSDS